MARRAYRNDEYRHFRTITCRYAKRTVFSPARLTRHSTFVTQKQVETIHIARLLHICSRWLPLRLCPQQAHAEPLRERTASEVWHRIDRGNLRPCHPSSHSGGTRHTEIFIDRGISRSLHTA